MSLWRQVTETLTVCECDTDTKSALNAMSEDSESSDPLMPTVAIWVGYSV